MDPTEAHIFLGIALKGGVEEKNEIIELLDTNGFAVTDLSTNDMARLHKHEGDP